jgi:predicted PurR-regulated permease PerM
LNDIAAIRRLLEVLVLIALFVTAYFAKDLLLPILLGFLLALTLSSFEKFGISPPLGAVLLIGFVGLIIFVLAGLSAGTVATWSDEIPSMGNEIQRKLQGWMKTVEDVRSATEQVEKIGADNGASKPEEVVVKQPGLLDNAMNTDWRHGGRRPCAGAVPASLGRSVLPQAGSVLPDLHRQEARAEGGL